MYIGLVGPIASGKGEAVRILREAGMPDHSLSNEVRRAAATRGMEMTRDSLVGIGNELRGTEPGYFARKVVEQILSAGHASAVIDGIRNPAEVEYLRSTLGVLIVSIDAPEDQRLARYLARGRTEDGASAEAFRRMNSRDLGNGEPGSGQQVAACMSLADAVIYNDGTASELAEKITQFLNSLREG